MITRSTLWGILHDADVEDTDVRFEYSGRAMYGKTCFGFVGSLASLATFFYQLGVQSTDVNELGDVAEELSMRLRSDDMGFGTIWYFPGFEVHDDSEDDSEDEGAD
jgi:hypothetical protein